MVGVTTAGASIRSTVLLAELDRRALVPAKVAVRGYEPAATFGVIEQDTRPAPSVVPEQGWPASEKLTVAPLTATGGEADASTSVALKVSGLFGAPPSGLVFKLRKVLCLPSVQLKATELEIISESLIFAKAINRSVPVRTPV